MAEPDASRCREEGVGGEDESDWAIGHRKREREVSECRLPFFCSCSCWVGVWKAVAGNTHGAESARHSQTEGRCRACFSALPVTSVQGRGLILACAGAPRATVWTFAFQISKSLSLSNEHFTTISEKPCTYQRASTTCNGRDFLFLPGSSADEGRQDPKDAE